MNDCVAGGMHFDSPGFDYTCSSKLHRCTYRDSLDWMDMQLSTAPA